MWQAIPQIIIDFASSDDVRVVVMRGAGDKAFVSGADISEFEEVRNTPEQIAEIFRVDGGLVRDMIRRLEQNGYYDLLYSGEKHQG